MPCVFCPPFQSFVTKHYQMKGLRCPNSKGTCFTLFELREVIWSGSALCIQHLLITSAKLLVEPALGDAASSHISPLSSLFFICPLIISSRADPRPIPGFSFRTPPPILPSSALFVSQIPLHILLVCFCLPLLHCELYDSRNLLVLFTPVSLFST